MQPTLKQLAAALLCTPVFALVPPVQVAAQETALEEVIVTARKREQSLQDVSVAVSVLSAGDIAANQIRNSQDLTTLVPALNLQKGASPRETSFNIRGIGTQSFSTAAEPSVSTMIDGVVMGRSMQAFTQLLDIQRIEVLRGPQGTLFGKNSTGGVVHIITENPAEEFEGEVLGGYEEGEEYRAGLNISGPLGKKLGFRLSGFGADQEGWIKNHFDGNHYNRNEEWSLRGKLRWTPTDELALNWTSDYSESEGDSASAARSLEPFGGNDAEIAEILAELAPVVPGKENDEININKPPLNDWDSWGHALQVDWDIGTFTLTSITAYRESSIAASGDADARPTDPLGFDQSGATQQEQWTQEIRLSSPAEDRLNYVVGLFYFDQKVSREFRREFEFVPGNPGIGVSSFSVDTENWAAFGEATFEIIKNWRVIAGARFTQDDLSFIFRRTREGFPAGVPDPVAATPGGTDENDLSGKLALEWDYIDTGMVYLSYVQGYKGPAYDVTFGTDPTSLQPVAPETSESWELGLKSSLFDNRLILNVALFHSEYDDFQGQSFFDPDGDPGCPADNPGCDPDDEPGSFQLVSAGKVETEGLEIDFTALPLPNLRVFGGVAIVDASIVDYPGGNCSFGQTFRGECPGGLQDLSGGEMPFSPDWKASVTVQYTWERDAAFDVQLQGTLRAQDEILFDLSQDEFTRLDAYETVDMSARLLGKADHWDATVYVKNVFDEFYVAGIGANIDIFMPNGYLHQVPRYATRTVGAEVRYRW